MDNNSIYEPTGPGPYPMCNTGVLECPNKPQCLSTAGIPTCSQTGAPPTRNTIYAPFPSQSNRAENNQPETSSVRRLSWPRHNRRTSYRLGCDQDEEVNQEAVDLLQTLPESQIKDSPIVPGSARTTPALSARPRNRFPREEESEDSSGLYDEAVLYYNSLCNTHGNREPERIAFLSRSYSALERNKRNNGSNKSPECASRTMNVAEYCTSKLHSKSCGSLTCPKFEKNKLTARKQVFPEHKSRKRKQLKRFKRWVFITAILLGIVLAITGIVVAFLVFAPFRMGVHQCRVGYVWCGTKGCRSPQQICSRPKDCPGALQELICHGNRSEIFALPKTTFAPFTLSPLLRNSDSQYEPDAGGWVYYTGGSTNGSRYINIPKALTFSGGQDACRDQGGHLVHINSVGEQLFLQDYLEREIANNVFPRGTIGFWTGARRARGSHSGNCMYDQWRWLDVYGRSHGVVSGFAAFVPGKPDNYYAPEECLYISINNGNAESSCSWRIALWCCANGTCTQSTYMKWDDAPCDIRGIGSIMAVCEVEILQ